MLTIGDFSRATLLTIKTLRHYHDTGLLAAAEVDPQSVGSALRGVMPPRLSRSSMK
jgi:hypothetical protein